MASESEEGAGNVFIKAQDPRTIVRYWADSIEERQRMQIKADDNTMFRIPRVDVVSRGKLQQDLLVQLFTSSKEDQGNDQGKTIESHDVEPKKILLCPIVFRKPIRPHGGVNAKEFVIAPLWIPAQLHPDGTLSMQTEAYPWIPRMYLDPLEKGTFALGTAQSQDEWYQKHPLPKEDTEGAWTDYLRWCNGLFSSVTGSTVNEFGIEGYTKDDEVALVVSEGIKGVNIHILKLYEYLVKTNEVPFALQSLANVMDADDRELDPSVLQGAHHLGQMNNTFPLSPSQRISLHHALCAEAGEVLAVNGPPGTGKTTLLQSVVATLWVKAALEKANAPIIAAASANNQAVTNVIESFDRKESSTESEKKTTIEDRWIPNMKSYGLYCSSVPLKEAGDKARDYHTVYTGNRGFMADMESRFLDEDFASTFLCHVKQLRIMMYRM